MCKSCAEVSCARAHTTSGTAVDVDGNSSSKSTVFTFDVGNKGLGYDVGWILRPQSGDSEVPSDLIGHGFAVELARSVVNIHMNFVRPSLFHE
jgi:hypothetical protein